MRRERSHQINRWHVKSIKNKKEKPRNKNEIELENIQLKQICTIDYKKRKDLQILSDDIRIRERQETELMLKEDILMQNCYSYNKLSSEYNKIAIDSLKTINDYTYFYNNNIYFLIDIDMIIVMLKEIFVIYIMKMVEISLQFE